MLLVDRSPNGRSILLVTTISGGELILCAA